MWSAFRFQHLRVVEYCSREVPRLVTVESDAVHACSGKVWMRCGSNCAWACMNRVRDHLFKWTWAWFTIQHCVHAHETSLLSAAPVSGPLA